jgi:hypothetical protein
MFSNGRGSRLFRSVLCAMACALGASADAYDIGGHHYTISSILAHAPSTRLSEGNIQPSDPPGSDNRADPYEVLESFCVEMPDLVAELDAITQRIHVLKSHSDWQWGSLGRCSTSVSRHMVAAQWYVHGLTGMETARVRGAAETLIRVLQGNASRATDPQSKVNLSCEVGFGFHLLGDTFAHSRLDKPEKLYPTGTGHWQDKHIPDYMLSRDIRNVAPGSRWSDWIREASKLLGRPDVSGILGQISQPILANAEQRADDFGDTILTSHLIYSLPHEDQWEPYNPRLETWSNGNVVGDISAWPCSKVIASGPNGRGVPAIEGAVPDCNAVWNGYLKEAIAVFRAAGADPVHDGDLGGCDAANDRLAYGNL